MNKVLYWPKFINGEEIKLNMDENEVVTQTCLPGKLDGIGFEIISMT